MYEVQYGVTVEGEDARCTPSVRVSKSITELAGRDLARDAFDLRHSNLMLQHGRDLEIRVHPSQHN